MEKQNKSLLRLIAQVVWLIAAAVTAYLVTAPLGYLLLIAMLLVSNKAAEIGHTTSLEILRRLGKLTGGDESKAEMWTCIPVGAIWLLILLATGFWVTSFLGYLLLLAMLLMTEAVVAFGCSMALDIRNMILPEVRQEEPDTDPATEKLLEQLRGR